jgi:ribosomal protein S20
MNDNFSCTTDATSDIGDRLNKAVEDAIGAPENTVSNQLKEAQKTIEELRKRGLLKRQEYAAGKSADFKKLLMRKH